MAKLLVVLPVITETYADKCIETLLMPKSSAGFAREDILIIDNSRHGFAVKYKLRTHRDRSRHNLGVARSWNIGAQEVLDKKLDYLVILSASMIFGTELHCTFLSQMKAFWGENVIEAHGHSWHMIAIHRRVFEQVGLFDSNFYPAYFEAIDFSYRMRMAGLEHDFIPVWFNAMSQGSALHNEVVHIPADPLLDYYKRKWGGDKGQETFKLPFGDKPISYFKDIPIPELAERYKLVSWW